MKGGGAWKRFGFFAIGLQAYGLLLETIADHQKMVFKSQSGNRNQWCNVGLWKFSTDPGFLGELLFWLGAFLGGLSCYCTHLERTMVLWGILFISVGLRDGPELFGSKDQLLYGNNVEFLKFRQTHSMWGPIPWKKSQDLKL
jgi:steroid 5-alpha reductase family enzyme